MRIGMMARGLDDLRLVVISDDDRLHDPVPWLRNHAELNARGPNGTLQVKDLFTAPEPAALLRSLADSIGDLPLLDPQEGWRPSLPDPGGEIFCVGRNYAAHAAELGNDVPGAPMIFQKPRQCMIATGEPIPRPNAKRVDFEGELMLVIGERLDGPVDADGAGRAIAAVTLFNDISDRDAQNAAKQAGKPWFKAKGRKGFGPLGPVLRITRPGEELTRYRYRTLVDGELRQTGDPALWIWRPEDLLTDLATSVGLRPGDMIATGTPAGVGNLSAGETVEIECEQIGRLSNPVHDENPQ